MKPAPLTNCILRSLQADLNSACHAFTSSADLLISVFEAAGYPLASDFLGRFAALVFFSATGARPFVAVVPPSAAWDFRCSSTALSENSGCSRRCHPAGT